MSDYTEITETPADPETMRATIAEREAEIARLNRRIEIDGALREARVIDLEIGALLVERAISAADPAGDIAAAVMDLRRRKPFLFEAARVRGVAQSPRTVEHPPRELERAAADAATTGHRTDLLRYLRLRRKRD